MMERGSDGEQEELVRSQSELELQNFRGESGEKEIIQRYRDERRDNGIEMEI